MKTLRKNAITPRKGAGLQLGPLIGLIFVWGLFAALRWDKFVTWGNTEIMLLQTTVVGTAAIGATLIIIAAGIDLSVGSVIALVTVVTALCLSAGVPEGGAMAAHWPWVACAAGIGASMLCGLATGAMVIGYVGRVAAVVFGGLLGWVAWPHLGIAGGAGVAVAVALLLWFINERLWKRIMLVPFIITLGMLGIVRGLAQGLADQQMVRAPQSWLNDLLSIGSGLPIGVVIMIGAAVITAMVLRYTRFGRYVVAIGSNENTARLCGIPIARMKLLIYTIGIGFAGLAGIMQFSYLRMGDPTTAPGYELNVIAAVVIGGGSLSGGQGSIFGSLIGALIMTIVANGCNKLGLDPWIQQIVTGCIIVAAVSLDQVRKKRKQQA